MKLTAPIFILKQQAKTLSRKEKIPLHQALDRIASREGFNAWSLLAAKAVSDRPSERFIEQLSPGDLALVAARPGQGKTLFSLELAVETIRRGNQAAFFTLEFTQADVAGCLETLGERVTNFTDRLLIDDSDQICADYIADRLASALAKMLVIIDYLQLLRSTSRRAQDNRQLEISEISAGLKALAKELKIPVIVVAQLNRQPEQRSGGKPRLSDLRESGSIEQDADLVGLLVRPEMYEEDEEARVEKAGEAELIIAKQRNGPVGEIPLTFLKEYTRFETRARNVSEPEERF